MHYFNQVINEKRGMAGLALIVISLALFLLNVPSGYTINTRNSDAPWHVLLITQCMDEVPKKVHKMLPIVTLGAEENKGIPWGVCVPDELGNYYYTSFMPLSFIVPYLFFKLPGMTQSIFSLQVLTAMLSLISVILMYQLLLRMFGSCCKRSTILFFTIIVYLLTPEMLHSNLEVFWGQTLYQPFFILQLILFHQYLHHRGRHQKAVRVALPIVTFIGCSIEWSAFVMSAGLVGILFACSFQGGGRHHKKMFNIDDMVEAFWLMLASVLALGVFILHFLSVLDADTLFHSMMERMKTRSVVNVENAGTMDLLTGYNTSFGYVFMILLVMAVCLLARQQSRQELWKQMKGTEGMVILAAGITCLENVLMRQHAVEYSYDRMKIGVLLLLCLFLLITTAQRTQENSGVFLYSIGICCVCLAVISYYEFRGTDNYYRWKIAGSYEKNEQLANYLNGQYALTDSVYGQIPVTAVRGYATLLFHRNIYDEVDSLEEMEQLAKEKKVRYAVYLLADYQEWPKYVYHGAVISDLKEGKRNYIEVSESGIRSGWELQKGELYAMPFSGDGIDLGVFLEQGIVRFVKTEEWIKRLERAAAIQNKNGIFFDITDITVWDEYIDVTVQVDETQKEACKDLCFPNAVTIVEEQP